MKTQLKKYWFALIFIQSQCSNNLKNANSLYKVIEFHIENNSCASQAGFKLKFIELVLQFYEKAKADNNTDQNTLNRIKKLKKLQKIFKKAISVPIKKDIGVSFLDRSLPAIWALLDDSEKKMVTNNVEPNSCDVRCHIIYSVWNALKETDLLENDREQIFRGLLTVDGDILDCLSKIPAFTDSCILKVVEPIIKEYETIDDLERIYATTFKIRRQTHNAYDFCYNYMKPTLTSQIQKVLDAANNIVTNTAIFNNLTKEAQNLLMENMACLEVLLTAYEKGSLNEFILFIKQPHTKKNFTIQIANPNEDKKTRLAELKAVHFYGIAAGSISRMNANHTARFNYEPEELLCLRTSKDAMPILKEMIKEVKKDKDYIITNIPETIRQLEDWMNGELIPKRIISAYTQKRQEYQGPKKYFKNSVLPEWILEKNDHKNQPSAQYQTTSQTPAKHNNKNIQKGWSTTKKVVVTGVTIASALAIAGITYYLIKKNNTKTNKI